MKISHLLSLAALIVTAGCDGNGEIRLPPTEIKVFHAASNIDTLAFNRERSQLGLLEYGQGLAASFDSGQYDFVFQHQAAGVSALVDLVSFSETLSADLDYLFIALTRNGQPGVFVVTTDDLPPGATTARITIAHAFEGRGDLDVYVELPGTVLSTVTPRTSISFDTNPSAFETDPSINNIFLTTAGNPNDVVFESEPQAFAAGADIVYVVSDPGALGTADIDVSVITTTVSGQIGQIGLESRVRVIQGIDDRLARDIYLDDTLTSPLFPAQPFGVFSNYENTEISAHTVITTPVSAPGTEEDAFIYFASPGRLFTALIAGDSVNGVVTRVITEDKRSIDGEAAIRFHHFAGLFDIVDLYFERPGTDITTVNPLLPLSVTGSTQRFRLVPDDYEITIVDFATQAILAGPQVLTVDDGGVYGVLLLNSASGSTVDIELFDDFIP